MLAAATPPQNPLRVVPHEKNPGLMDGMPEARVAIP